MLEQLLALDAALLQAVNLGLSNPLLDGLFSLITLLGSVWFWVPASVVVLYVNRRLGRRFVFGLVGLNAALLLLKGLFARPRPYEALQGLHVLDNETFGSFPSGHTANVFLAAFLLSLAYPKYKWHFYALAVIVAFSRVYLGVHYPLDVIAGAAVGIAAGYAVVRLLPGKKKKSLRE